MEALNIDINELVTREVNEKIEALELSLKNSYENNEKLQCKNNALQQEKDSLKERIEYHANSLFLLDNLKSTFSKIKSKKKQFLFIEKILLTFYGIEREQGEWYCDEGSKALGIHLAINYYKNKEIVIKLLNILLPTDNRPVQIIKSFRMPYDYTKEEVIEYVKSPHYCTNGIIIGISRYWIEMGACKINMPHDLIMKNPFILEEDIFNELIQSIEQHKSNSEYMWALPQYNEKITQKQIERLGECIVYKELSINNSNIRSFIDHNFKKLNTKTVNYLYKYTSGDNQFKTLHWKNFPLKWQYKYLKTKNIAEVLKLLMSYPDCGWTVEEKETFLREYFRKE